MKKLNRSDKIYLDKKETEESSVNSYLACRDCIVEFGRKYSLIRDY